jgi:hypothetical protein
MEDREFVDFLKGTLVKIENAINLLNHYPPRHIPAYRKILGVQQKLNGLPKESRDQMFSQFITVKSILSYFLNGRYEEGAEQIERLRVSIVTLCLQLQKHERDSDKKV